MTWKTHSIKIAAYKRSLLYMQNNSLKIWKFETAVLHINLGACTRFAFLNQWVFDVILSGSLKILKLVMADHQLRKLFSVKINRCIFKMDA